MLQIQLTLTETKLHIKTKAVLIIDFDLVINVTQAGLNIIPPFLEIFLKVCQSAHFKRMSQNERSE